MISMGLGNVPVSLYSQGVPIDETLLPVGLVAQQNTNHPHPHAFPLKQNFTQHQPPVFALLRNVNVAKADVEGM